MILPGLLSNGLASSAESGRTRTLRKAARERRDFMRVWRG
jgi:hypothetical protein